MSEGGESKTVGAFFLGFLLGCLVSLGGAGTFLTIQSRRSAMAAEMEAMRAREHAEEAHRRALEAERAAKQRPPAKKMEKVKD